MSTCSVALLPAGVAAREIARERKVHAARHDYGSHSTQEQLVFLPGLLDFYWIGRVLFVPITMLHGCSWKIDTPPRCQ